MSKFIFIALFLSVFAVIALAQGPEEIKAGFQMAAQMGQDFAKNPQQGAKNFASMAKAMMPQGGR